jgi:hypothetical protein
MDDGATGQLHRYRQSIRQRIRIQPRSPRHAVRSAGRRRVGSALSASCSAVGNGRMASVMASAKRAISRASSLSVLPGPNVDWILSFDQIIRILSPESRAPATLKIKKSEWSLSLICKAIGGRPIRESRRPMRLKHFGRQSAPGRGYPTSLSLPQAGATPLASAAISRCWPGFWLVQGVQPTGLDIESVRPRNRGASARGVEFPTEFVKQTLPRRTAAQVQCPHAAR